MELMSVLHNSTDIIVHYFIKELEHTWRVKFQECKEVINSNKMGVDQCTVIIDMKGMKLKDITNKQILQVFKQLTLEVQRFFPELLHKLYILNTPMFFENAWEGELSACIDKETLQKVYISGDDSHDDLLAEVDEKDLPEIYGGECECEATCVYSDKGPWCDIENTINYKDPDAKKKMDSDDDPQDMDERILNSLKFMLGGGKMQEEFKMQEGDEDNIDLLTEKSKSKDLSEFYAQNEQIEDLKNSIRMNIPGMKHGGPSSGQPQTNNNTEAGETESSEQQALI